MKIKKVWFRNVGIFLLFVLLCIQFIHPTKNSSDDKKADISATLPVPESIQQILKTSCYDCHSNYTDYPWYSKIQPVDWWLNDHINEGKRELNFSTFSAYRLFRQYHKLESIIEELKDDEMPLSSYLIIHGNAKLSASQKTELTSWAESLCDTLKSRYPADSLVNPKKRGKR